ncbi:PQQ-like beta-propeller repeat protein [Pirellulales bacterium]|nr:PQQ-like beta-propeller repeat protein [Pirellulales bacterium]
MSTIMPKYCHLACAALLFVSPAFAEDWPQWRGPERDDLSQETGLLQDWPEGGPKLAWVSRDCGIGYGGPAIVDGRIYILGSRDNVEQLIVFDENNGKELWSAPLGAEYENHWGNGPRGTPTVVGGVVYALAARGKLTCLDRKTGQEIWSKEMQDFGGTIPNWGYTESPLVHRGRIICTPGGDDGAIAALNAKTGGLLWQTESLKTTAHYSSPIIVERSTGVEVVQLLQMALVGVDFESGNVNWQVPWPGRTAVIPTPIGSGDQVYASSGYGVGSMLVRVGPGDDDVSKVYENKVMKNQHGGVILLGDHLYGYSDGVGWVCQDLATGDRVWREREALGKGAIGYADNRFYCIAEDSGEVVLIAASHEGWEEHGRFTLSPQTELRKEAGKIWTHPVISNGKLYLRDQELFFAFDVAGRSRTAAK